MPSILGWWFDGLRTITAKFDRVDVYRGQKYDKIRRNLTDRKSVFEDVFFPSSKQSLGSLAVVVEDVMEWKRPTELSVNPKLFDNNADTTIVRGGELSCNWIVSALSVLSCVKELCYKIIPNYRDQEWKSGATDKSTGIFHFRFWRFGQWVDVVIDDLLPVVDGKLIFTHSQSRDEFWVSLVEKAYAKLLGSYDALEGGHMADALVDVTGGASEIIDLKAGDYDSNEDLRAELFQLLLSEMADHSLICASIPTQSQEEVRQRTEMGLIKGHVYFVTAVRKIHLGDSTIRNLLKGREKVSMIRLRNPYGNRVSAHSTPDKNTALTQESEREYAFSTSQLTRLLSRNPAWAKIKESDRGRIGLTVEHEGEFWMPVEDFVSHLGELTIVRFYNNNIFARGRRWKESAMKGCWSIDEEKGPLGFRSGGGNSNSETFLQNPQFTFQVESPEQELVIQMLQWDGREAPSATNTPGHSRNRTLLIGFTVIRVEQNRKYRLHKLWPFYQIVVTIDHQRRRELYYRGHLPKGKYLLVPTTYKPRCEGCFLIRIISQVEIKLKRLERDVGKRMCSLPRVLSRNSLWVTVISVGSAVGIAGAKNVYCSIRCEDQKVKTQIVSADREMVWDEDFVFYRKSPERPIIIKVYDHHVLKRNTYIGWAEIPASVNHAQGNLEVTLMGRTNHPLENTMIRLKVLTEDNLLSL